MNFIDKIDQFTLTEEHRDDLIKNHAITAEVIELSRIQSWAKGTAHRWINGDTWMIQYRVAPEHRDPDMPKYFGPKDAAPPINRLREPDGRSPIILAEGTLQHLAVASYAPSGMGVYGMYGCWGWKNADLSWADGAHVLVMLDADMTTNRQVWSAASGVMEALEIEGAASVRFVMVPSSGKDGIDDVLARREESKRANYLARLIERATDKLPKAPAKNSNPDTIAAKLRGVQPMANTREKTIAIYRGGVYLPDPEAFNALMARTLGSEFTRGLRDNVADYIRGQLFTEGRFLPERMNEPILNVTNGLLDLRTGELRPHDPEHLSAVQVPVSWDPDATCPTYDTWVKEVIPDQLDDLEEVASTMLDPSRTPAKSIFLFGPSRSGKSTFLRIMRRMAGDANTSSVTLHQLADDRFAAANVYGKILNVAADLSARHVQDLSTFKMLTGQDQITANRKYGHEFSFTNRALFAFSANEIPTVSEGSTAYTERMKPFKFANSFAGREDDSIERKIMTELPGILVRWVAAWQRKADRGAYSPTVAEVEAEFATKSDRVAEWVADYCHLTTVTAAGAAVTPGSLLPPVAVSSKRELYRAFCRWVDETKTNVMSERTFIGRLTSLNGVVEVRREGSKSRGLNIALKGVNGRVAEVADSEPKHLPENEEPFTSFHRVNG